MSAREFKVFFATDLHGSTTCFKKFIAAKKFYNIDYLILGGDLSGKAIAIIYQLSDGNFNVHNGEIETMIPKELLQNYLDELEKCGIYYHITEDRFQLDLKEIENLYRQKVIERFKQWISYAESRLDEKDKILFTAGNDDIPKVDSVFKKSRTFIAVDGQCIKIDNLFYISGYSWTTPTPWKTAREKSEFDIERDLRKIGYSQYDLPLILNFHVPPKGIGIDTATAIDEEFNPIVKSMGVEKINVGSEAVFNYIQIHKPALGLFGHVHEARGFTKVGNTVCINPGSIFYTGKLQGCICSFQDDRLISWQLTEG